MLNKLLKLGDDYLKVKKSSLIFVVILFSMLIWCSFFKTSARYVNIIGLLSVAAAFYTAYILRSNTSLCICFFFIAYSIYSIVIAVYLFPELRPAFYTQFHDFDVYCAGMQCIFVFVFVLLILIKNSNLEKTIYLQTHKLTQINNNTIQNDSIVLGCVLAIIIISVTNIKLGDFSERFRITPLYEYRIIFFIIGMIYSGKNLLWKRLWLVLTIISCFIAFIGGNRADAIPLPIAYVYFYYNRLNPKNLFIGLIGAIIIMISVGTFRQNILRGDFAFSILFQKILNEKLTFDTSYWAYVPAMAAISLSNKTPLAKKVQLFWGQIKYIFGGSRYNDFRLVFYTKLFFAHTNGFVSPLYFYFWFGLWGAVIFALLVYAYVRCIYVVQYNNGKFKKGNQNINKALSAYFVSSVPRWFLYEPFGLLRGEMITLIVALIAGIINSLMSRNIVGQSDLKTSNSVDL